MGGGGEGEVADTTAHEWLLGKEPAPEGLVYPLMGFDLRGGEEKGRQRGVGGLVARFPGRVVFKEVVDEEGGTLGVERIKLESDNSLIISVDMQSRQKQKYRPGRCWTCDPLCKEQATTYPQEGNGGLLCVFLGGDIGDVAPEGEVRGDAAFGASGGHSAHSFADGRNTGEEKEVGSEDGKAREHVKGEAEIWVWREGMKGRREGGSGRSEMAADEQEVDIEDERLGKYGGNAERFRNGESLF